MHARTDQLLSVLDREPVDATVHAHIEQCASCAAQLAELTRTTEQLRDLPQLEAPELAWEQIAARLPTVRTARPQWRRAAAVAAAGCAVLALGIAAHQWRAPESPQLSVARLMPAMQRSGASDTTSIPTSRPQLLARSGAQLAAPDVSRAQYIARSGEQEEVLAFLPQRPAVQRPSLAMTMDAIEQRVQWLDWRLSEPPPEDRLNEEQSRVLWRERVTLVDSLIKLRYAESERF